MLNKKHALVFMWTGNEISEDSIVAMSNYFVQKGYTSEELLSVHYKDDIEIASSIITSAKQVCAGAAQTTAEEAIHNAVIYIGERFEGSLADTKTLGSLVNFALALQPEASKAYAKDERLRNHDETCLVNAIEILSTATGTIPTTLAKKYHITRGVISIIKQIYNQFK